MRRRASGLCRLAACTALPALLGCDTEKPERRIGAASVPIAGEGRFDAAELESRRLDPSWRTWADRDRVARGGGGRASDPAAPGPAAPGSNPTPGAEPPGVERFEHITALSANRPPRLPVPATGGGPSAVHVQVLLDRARFSPGAIDGRWGKNTEKAVYWFQSEQGLEPTGRVDAATYERLRNAAGSGDVIERYTVTGGDLAGPFVAIPEDVYEKAELECLCYESPWERLSERFHIEPALLEQLNPGANPESLGAGATLVVPNVRRDPAAAPGAKAARIVISRRGFYTHALDDDGRILHHFPSTLGSEYDPTPHGDYRVSAVTLDPHFRYQPELFHDVPDEDPPAMLPPGPNSPVGLVWVQLSRPHYGIHGTSEPQTIGYTTSHGCVRLTNWDARALARRTGAGTPVEFR